MDIQDIKFPTSQEEMDALRKMIRQEISDDDLDAVTGGNDDPKGKNPQMWTCPGCGATMKIFQTHDKAKHMVKCPANPFK